IFGRFLPAVLRSIKTLVYNKKKNISNEKCQIIKTRPFGLCHAKIKIECEKEAVKNYLPLAITATVKEYAMIELDLSASVQELKRKEVTNIKYKVHEPIEVHLVGNSDLKLDISQSGIVFAYPEQLKKLENHEWLTLIDSTHKTNRYDWHLFTLYIRNTYGCWNIGAHFFVSSEDSDTVAEALKKICNYCHWTPFYILLDQSNVEFKSIKIVFPDVNAVTSTNPFESYHSKLKRKTSSLYGLIGAIYNIVAIDCKKQSDSKSAAFDFRVKKVSAYGVEKDIIDARRFTNFPYHFNIYLLKRPVP
ncbi:unnamed protein product, partial [Rhizophagus irregularis]